MSDSRQQLQYLTTQTRKDLERVIEPDRLQFETDKAIFTLLTDDLASAVNRVRQNIYYYPNQDEFLKAVTAVQHRYDIFNLVAEDVIVSRQLMLHAIQSY